MEQPLSEMGRAWWSRFGREDMEVGFGQVEILPGNANETTG